MSMLPIPLKSIIDLDGKVVVQTPPDAYISKPISRYVDEFENGPKRRQVAKRFVKTQDVLLKPEPPSRTVSFQRPQPFAYLAETDDIDTDKLYEHVNEMTNQSKASDSKSELSSSANSTAVQYENTTSDAKLIAKQRTFRPSKVSISDDSRVLQIVEDSNEHTTGLDADESNDVEADDQEDGNDGFGIASAYMESSDVDMTESKDASESIDEYTKMTPGTNLQTQIERLVQKSKDMSQNQGEQYFEYEQRLHQLQTLQILQDQQSSSSTTASGSPQSCWHSTLKLVVFDENQPHTVPSTCWGPGAWAFLESQTQWFEDVARYPRSKSTTAMIKKKGDRFITYLQMLQFIIPTPGCRHNFINYLNKYPLQVKNATANFLHVLHNDVSIRKHADAYTQAEAKSQWTAENFNGASRQKRRDAIKFRCSIPYSRNAFANVEWDALHEIQAVLRKLYSYNPTNPTHVSPFGCKLVRIWSCRASMFALFHCKDMGGFFFMFYSALRDTVMVFIFHDSAVNQENMSIEMQTLGTQYGPFPTISRVNSYYVGETRDLMVFSFMDPPETGQPASESGWFIAFDMVQEAPLQRSVLHDTFVPQWSKQVAVDTEKHVQPCMMRFENKIEWNRVNCEFVAHSKIMRSLDSYYLEHKTISSYLSRLGNEIVRMEPIVRDVYKHSVFPFKIDRHARSQPTITVSLTTLDENGTPVEMQTVDIDKKDDLDQKAVSIHMIEDHWQTGLVLFYQQDLSFHYVPLNPIKSTHPEQAKPKLAEIVQHIIRTCNEDILKNRVEFYTRMQATPVM